MITNKQHYRDMLIQLVEDKDSLAVVNDRPTSCSRTDCRNCDFRIAGTDCKELIRTWLNSPYRSSVIRWDEVLIDTPLEITYKSGNHTPEILCFAGHETGRIYCFANGKNRYTADYDPSVSMVRNYLRGNEVRQLDLSRVAIKFVRKEDAKEYVCDVYRL